MILLRHMNQTLNKKHHSVTVGRGHNIALTFIGRALSALAVRGGLKVVSKLLYASRGNDTVYYNTNISIK